MDISANHEIRILLSGGGTAGHVSPGIAIYEAFQRECAAEQQMLAAAGRSRPACTTRWLGSERIESRLVPEAGISFKQLDIRFSYRWPTPRNWGYYRKHLFPLLAGVPFRQALEIVELFHPDVVVGLGGYVSAPAVYAAMRLGIPYALVQLDSPPGLVNWSFAPRAWRIFASTPQVAQSFTGCCSPGKIQLTGFPVTRPRRSRAQVFDDLGLEPGRRLIVAMGGSLGAGAVYRAVRELLRAAAEPGCAFGGQLTVLCIAGERENLARTILDPAGLPPSPVKLHLAGYVPHAVDVIHAADFYIGRSGAATVGELVAAGIPALLIPDPQHADRQQYFNAQPLLLRGQAEALEQHHLEGKPIVDWLKRIWAQPRLEPPTPPAADLIAASLLTLLEGR